MTYKKNRRAAGSLPPPRRRLGLPERMLLWCDGTTNGLLLSPSQLKEAAYHHCLALSIRPKNIEVRMLNGNTFITTWKEVVEHINPAGDELAIALPSINSRGDDVDLQATSEKYGISLKKMRRLLPFDDSPDDRPTEDD